MESSQNTNQLRKHWHDSRIMQGRSANNSRPRVGMPSKGGRLRSPEAVGRSGPIDLTHRLSRLDALPACQEAPSSARQRRKHNLCMSLLTLMTWLMSAAVELLVCSGGLLPRDIRKRSRRYRTVGEPPAPQPPIAQGPPSQRKAASFPVNCGTDTLLWALSG